MTIGIHPTGRMSSPELLTVLCPMGQPVSNKPDMVILGPMDELPLLEGELLVLLRCLSLVPKSFGAAAPSLEPQNAPLRSHHPAPARSIRRGDYIADGARHEISQIQRRREGDPDGVAPVGGAGAGGGQMFRKRTSSRECVWGECVRCVLPEIFGFKTW